jgi:hypothetical protein
MNKAQEKINESIDKINKFKDHVNEAAEYAEDVKSGEFTADEERQDPSYVLYNRIADTTVNIMKLPSVGGLFESIAEKLDPETAQKFMELIAICMTHSAYQAVAWYDKLLKEELTKNFENIAGNIDTLHGELVGQKGALEVFKTRLSKLDKESKVNEMNK